MNHAHTAEVRQDQPLRVVPVSPGERNTRRVIALTLVTMVAEVVAGSVYNSMALLADGWHMGSHAAALGITWFAYYWSRRNARNQRYSFGTGKVGVLGGFTSAVVLGVVALVMVWESGKAFFRPRDIGFDEAMGVAVLGLIVNLISAWMLRGEHHHHGHHHHSDHNLRAAYLHVVADALTSVLAIGALAAGKWLGWVWMDPAVGIVGAVVIGRWAFGLVRDTGRILLDSSVPLETVDRLRTAIESQADNAVADLHVWRVAPDRYAAIVSVVTHDPQPPEHYKALLPEEPALAHVTVEVHQCGSEECEPKESGPE